MPTSAGPPDGPAPGNPVIICAALGVLFGALWSSAVAGVALGAAICYSGSLDRFLEQPPALPHFTAGISAYLAAACAAWIGGVAGCIAGGRKLPRGRWRSVLFPSACDGATGAALAAIAGLTIAWTAGPAQQTIVVSMAAGIALGTLGGWYGGKWMSWIPSNAPIQSTP